MRWGCRTFQYVLPFVFVWLGLLSYLRVYLYFSCAWCCSRFVRFLRDSIRLIVLLILEIYNVQSQVEIENKSAKASQWTMWWNTKPQMLGQGAQTSSAVLSASVLVLSGVDMGSQVFAPPLKLVARVSPTDIWQNALWVPSWNLFDRPCVCQRYLELVLQVVNQPPRLPWPLIKVQGYWWKSHQFAWSARYSGCSGPCQGHKKDFSVSGRTSLSFVSASTGTVMGRLVLFRASIYPPPLTDSDTGGHLARRGVITEPGKPDYGPGNHIITHWPTFQAPFSLKGIQDI